MLIRAAIQKTECILFMFDLLNILTPVQEEHTRMGGRWILLTQKDNELLIEGESHS